MSHFAATEADRDFYLVSILQKAGGVAKFCVEIMGVDINRKPDFFNLYRVLVLPCFFFFLRLFKAKFAIIADSADRRSGIRRNKDKVQILVVCQILRFRKVEYAKLFIGRANKPDFFNTSDFAVNLQFLFSYTETPPKNLKHRNIGIFCFCTITKAINKTKKAGKTRF